jgi:hypothetical protein
VEVTSADLRTRYLNAFLGGRPAFLSAALPIPPWRTMRVHFAPISCNHALVVHCHSRAAARTPIKSVEVKAEAARAR